ncbi:MAG: condensation domain-containing protein, partial [Pseudonocardiaceae bacterium]
MTERTELAQRRARLSPAKQARLAEWITGEGRRRSIQRRRDPAPARLSFAQERLWFMEQLLPGTHANELPTALTLAGPLDLDVLDRALTEIVRRHDALRTRFPAPGGRAVQVVDPPWPVTLPLVEPDDDAPAFDLAADRLIRLSLARTGPHEHQLRVLAHHIVSDAWSQRLMVHELAALYEAFAAGRASPLTELPIQYADFAVWQRDQLAGPVLTAQLDYWRAQLAGPPPVLELPADRPRPTVPTYGGATLRRRLPAPLLTALRELAQRTNTTFY